MELFIAWYVGGIFGAVGVAVSDIVVRGVPAPTREVWRRRPGLTALAVCAFVLFWPFYLAWLLAAREQVRDMSELADPPAPPTLVQSSEPFIIKPAEQVPPLNCDRCGYREERRAHEPPRIGGWIFVPSVRRDLLPEVLVLSL